MTLEQRQTFLRILAIAGAIAISILIFAFRDQAAALAVYGYPGIFVLSILANATIVLPAPGIAIVFTMGGVLNPFLVGLVAGVGSAIGELSGYAAGFSGQAIIEDQINYDRILRWMQSHPRMTNLTLFILAMIPNPLFDLAGIAAGALKLSVWRFLLWCTLGKIIKMLFFAYAGLLSIDWLESLL